MKKANTILGLIFAVALAGGLLTVRWALHQAEQARSVMMLSAEISAEADAAAGAGDAAAGAGDATAGAGDAAAGAGDATAGAGDAAAGKGDAAAGAGDAAAGAGDAAAGKGDAAADRGDAAAAGAGDTATGKGDAAADRGDAAAAGADDTAAGKGDAAGAGDAAAGAGDAAQPSTAATLPALGEGELSLESLTAWMQTESPGGQNAKTLLATATALAAGVGVENDPERRAFAQSQGAPNDEGLRNMLAEKAMDLAQSYLRCRELLALQKENVAFYQALSQAVKAAQTGDDGKLPSRAARLAEDVATVQASLTEAEQTCAEAESDLASAVLALNLAVGNPATAAIGVTDPLKASPLPPLDPTEAVAQALKTRNEIKGAAYAIQREERTLTQLRYTYPPTAPEFLAQEAAVKKAQTAYPQIQHEVETEVRDRCAALKLSAQSLELLAQSDSAPPKTDYRLMPQEDKVKDLDEIWISNLGELKAPWLKSFANRQQVLSKTAQLNLDILAFEHAVGVGCTAAAI